jgi:hypothetical protein
VIGIDFLYSFRQQQFAASAGKYSSMQIDAVANDIFAMQPHHHCMHSNDSFTRAASNCISAGNRRKLHKNENYEENRFGSNFLNFWSGIFRFHTKLRGSGESLKVVCLNGPCSKHFV